MTTVPIAAPAIADQVEVRIFTDILNALSQYPAIAEAVRQHVLSDEIRHLPAAFVQLAATVERYMEQTNRILAELQSGQARHDADIADLKDGQARLEAGQAKLEAGQERLEAGQAKLKAGQEQLENGQAQLQWEVKSVADGQKRLQDGINGLSGSEYERRIARSLRRNSHRHFQINDGQLVHSITIPNNNYIPDLLDKATSQGIIGKDDADNAERIDIVIQGDGSDRRPAYAAIEASVTIEAHDITRARERADIISKAAGAPAKAAVCGARIDAETCALAGQYGVTVVILPA